jgi:urease accessory protein UreE
MSVLQVFKSLPVVHEVVREAALPPSASVYTRDTVTLGWEERLKARGRRRSDSGTEFGTALPRGTVLKADDCLICEPLERLFVVIERAEPVLIVEPSDPVEWGLFGYYIGNSHQPVMLTEHEIVCADLPGMDQVLEQHAIVFTRAVRPFTPVAMTVDHRH